MRVRGDFRTLAGLQLVLRGSDGPKGAGVFWLNGQQTSTDSTRRGLDNMTHGRMQTMTQCRDGIMLALKRAQGLMGVARRLSVVAATFVVAALLVGTAGTSYAHHHAGPRLADTVTVTNFGSAFSGTLATFKAGQGHTSRPFLFVQGANTLLSAGTGPAGVAVSSLDGHIGVSVPIDLIDLTGFGAFPAALACTAAGFAGTTAVGCCTAFHKGNCEPGTGFAEIFGPGSDKNSTPENIIGTRNLTFGNLVFGCTGPGPHLPCCSAPNGGNCTFNTTGVNTPQAIAFESPFDGEHPGKDIVAIGNTLPINFFSTTDLLDGTNGGAACAAFGAPTGNAAGFTVGTITEFDRDTLKSGFNDAVAPFNDSPVCVLPAAALGGGTPKFCPPGSTSGATIGGCLTFLLGPVGLAFDSNGFLFAVNEAAVHAAPPALGPGFVTVYRPGAKGDAFPAAVIGLIPGLPTAGAFIDPVKIAVLSDPDFTEDVIFVTDVGDNSVKIFLPFRNSTGVFFTGTQIGTIQGGATKFNRPEGIALNVDGTALYVVNNHTNSFEMFTDVGALALGPGGNIAPTLIVAGRNTRLDLPVDIALPIFTPTPTPTPDAHL
jgi:DNA-binding beta-propeller fold protein YncE